MTWTHVELQARLAAALRARTPSPMVYTEVAIDGAWGSEGRLDVVAAHIGSRYSGITLDGYEVKAQRSDWLRDHAADKWSRYLPMLDRLYLAVPAGANVVNSVTEVPEPLGVVTLDVHGRLRVIRKPGKLTPPHDRTGALLRLLRRQDTMLREALLPPESRHDRLERLARYQDDADLARHLSLRFLRAEQALAERTRSIEWEIRGLEERRAILKAELEAMGDVPAVLDSATRVLRTLTEATSPLRAGGHWAKDRRDRARATLAKVAALLEEVDQVG